MRHKTSTPLRTARAAAEMTQQDVADEWNRRWPSAAPKAAKAITYWEAWPGPTGRQPSIETLTRLAAIYGCRVGDLVDEPHDEPAPLEVAIAVVTRGDDVLLVQRADDLGWQFPAGTVKPGRTPDRVAVREVLAETGVHCAVLAELGSRIHPKTRALCRYFAADYLAGVVTNCDHDENAAAAWAPITDLQRFIADGSIYPPVLEHLGAAYPCLSLSTTARPS